MITIIQDPYTLLMNPNFRAIKWSCMCLLNKRFWYWISHISLYLNIDLLKYVYYHQVTWDTSIEVYDWFSYITVLSRMIRSKNTHTSLHNLRISFSTHDASLSSCSIDMCIFKQKRWVSGLDMLLRLHFHNY